MRMRYVVLAMAALMMAAACNGDDLAVDVAPEDVFDCFPADGEDSLGDPSPARDPGSEAASAVADQSPEESTVPFDRPETDVYEPVHGSPAVGNRAGITASVNGSGFVTMPLGIPVRITNHSDESFSMGRDYTVAYLSGSSWEQVPLDVVTTDDMVVIAPGETAELFVSLEIEGYIYRSGSYRIYFSEDLYAEMLVG